MADETTDTATQETTTAATPSGEAAAPQPPADATILGGEGDQGNEGGEGATNGAPADGGEGGEDQDAAAEGKPVVPEKYELSAPDGMTLAPDDVALAEPVFRELGLSNEQAQKLMPIAGTFAQRVMDRANQTVLTEVQAQRAAWAKEAQDDAEIGGGNWAGTLELSAKALDMLGYPKGSPFRSFLTDSGLGNHPEMIRAMRRIGEQVSEDTFERGGDANPSRKKTDAEIFYPEVKR